MMVLWRMERKSAIQRNSMVKPLRWTPLVIPVLTA